MKLQIITIFTCFLLIITGCAPPPIAVNTQAPEVIVQPTAAIIEPTKAPTLAPTIPPTEVQVTEQPTVPPKELKKVFLAHGAGTISVDHPDHYLGLPDALDFYRQEGLDVTVQATGGSNQALQLLIAGEADFAEVATDPAILTRAQGVPSIAVMTVISHGNSRTAVPEDSPIKELKDLKGKVIGIGSLSSSHVNVNRALAAYAGLDPDKDISFLPTGFGGEVVAALKSKQVDALGYWTGFFAGLEIQGFKFRYFYYPPIKKAPGFVLVTTEEYMKANPDVVIGIGRAKAKSLVYAFANPEATVKIYWKVFPDNKAIGIAEEDALEADVYRLNAQLQDATVDDRPDKRWGWNDPEGWKIYHDFLLDAGTLEKALDVESLYTNEFIDAFNDFDINDILKLAKAGFSE